MRKTFFILAGSLCLLLSCSKSEEGGTVVFRLKENPIAEVTTKGSVADYATVPSQGDFSLVVKNSLGSTIYSGLLSGWDSSTPLPNGNYSASATFSTAAEEGPSKPYFEGSASFAVTGGNTTAVSIPVSLGNCIVRIELTDAFRNYYPTSSFTISTPDNPAGFTYTGKAIFVAYQWTITGTLVGQNGAAYTLPERTWKGESATCYSVKYDISNVGGATITISFDDSVETVTLEEIELNS